MERFGRFVLLEHVARGGMAEVYRAALLGNAGFSRVLAIKRVLPHLAEDPHFVRLLVEEAHVASSLHHPHVVQVLDLGEVDGTYFIAMEYVAGRSLSRVFEAARARGFRLPQPWVVHVVGHVLAALSYVHGKTDGSGRPLGLVHRDVTPHNVLVGFDGDVKLADFGIAKALSVTDQTTGPLKGKPGYMSPEQVTHGPVDHRVDIYATGVILHELLAMRRMRPGDNALEVLWDVAHGVVPPLDQDDADPAVVDVVSRALAARPEERWPDAASMAAALDAVAQARGWRVTDAAVAETMRTLFQDAVDQEKQKQDHLAKVLSTFAANGSWDTPLETRSVVEEALPTLAADRPVASRVVRRYPRGRTAAVGASVLLAALAAGHAFTTPPVDAVLSSPGEYGSLDVQTVPAGARVWVGGQEAAGHTPLTVASLPAGIHDVEIRREGHPPALRLAEVHPGQATALLLLLPEAVTQVPLHSTPSGAVVTLDGLAAGRTPVVLNLAGHDPVEVSLSLPGFVAVSQRVEPARAPSSIHVSLVQAPPRTAPAAPVTRDPPPPAVTSPAGRLTLQSRPWARVILDGRDTGLVTPVVEWEVSAGEHQVELVSDEESTRETFAVTVRPGVTTRVSRTLPPTP